MTSTSTFSPANALTHAVKEHGRSKYPATGLFPRWYNSGEAYWLESSSGSRLLMVDFDSRTITGIIDRECEKRGLQWYSAKDENGEPTVYRVIAEVEALAPGSRKEARLMILDRLDNFPSKPVA